MENLRSERSHWKARVRRRKLGKNIGMAGARASGALQVLTPALPIIFGVDVKKRSNKNLKNVKKRKKT